MKSKYKTNKKKNLAKSILLCLAMGAGMFYTPPAMAAGNDVIANNTLPALPKTGNNYSANITDISTNGNVLNITQEGQNGFIKWQDFSVGANATVNFNGNVNEFNTLNYVNGGSASQIYGTINANNKGNIYVVNPAGVQIGNSAQINVGGLYVSNKKLTDAELTNLRNNPDNLSNFNKLGTRTNAELMSLGNINANKVTFDGGRIVIDVDRVKDTKPINIISNDLNNVVLGYTPDLENLSGNSVTHDISINDHGALELSDPNLNDYKYQWIRNVNQLQNIDNNLNQNYALRNAIDAVNSTTTTFTPIGKTGDGFKGKFDGLGFGIYGLNISEREDTDINTGLFGKTTDATIRNLELVGGSVTGYKTVGALVGEADHTKIENIVSSMNVTGHENIGGIIGFAKNSSDLSGLVNTGTTTGKFSVGGLVGLLENSKLEVTKSTTGSYNLGAVTGKDDNNTFSANIGGLVGAAWNSQLGSNSSNQIFNNLGVTGGYNVGGIVGLIEGNDKDKIKIENATNNGTITATGYIEGDYMYHTHRDTSKDANFPNQTTANATDINGVVATEKVNIANLGGIAGSATNTKITNVNNNGNIQTDMVEIT